MQEEKKKKIGKIAVSIHLAKRQPEAMYIFIVWRKENKTKEVGLYIGDIGSSLQEEEYTLGIALFFFGAYMARSVIL